jgi:anti-anti-sigma regulatory factor
MNTNAGEWMFPDIIEFETAPMLARCMDEFNRKDEIVFDLSKTTTIHSSFIGFLIHLKYTFDAQGRRFLLKTSPDIDRIFWLLHLNDFFSTSFH